MVGQADYHKLQGFIYSKLINSTSFKDIHDNKLSYKYFSYSNIFPPSSVKMGQSRYFLFASPDNELVKAVFETARRILEAKNTFNIGNQFYQLISAQVRSSVGTISSGGNGNGIWLRVLGSHTANGHRNYLYGFTHTGKTSSSWSGDISDRSSELREL